MEPRPQLSRIPPFDRLSADTLARVAQAVDVLYFRSGQTVLAEQEAPDALYVLTQGSVQVLDGNTVVARYGPEDCFDLEALLRDMVHHQAVTANRKSDVEIEFRVATNPPFAAHGHDGRYGQVFRNVIDNALSFSPPGTRILVELGREPRNGPFVVTIDDEGQGIPEDNLESIFQRFYSERPTEHFGQHSGLGLSICRQIMETYGGSITASNRHAPDGKVLGARFTIRIPAATGRK